MTSENHNLSKLLRRIHQDYELTRFKAVSFQGKKMLPGELPQMAGKTIEITFTMSETAELKMDSIAIQSIHVLEN